MELSHTPVLLEECLSGLAIKPNGVYVDGTAGGGGHSYEICRRLVDGRLIGIDQDPYAIERAGERLRKFGEKVTLVRDNFSNLSEVLDSLRIEKIDGLLLDLGVSSFQFDDASRGFSYRFDAKLDMRMSPDNPKTAAEVVNTYPEERLAEILFTYGEERFSRKIAKEICRSREEKPIETTFDLVELIKKAMPAAAKRESGHPAKRSFQAIRIEVNGELEILENSIRSAAGRLNRGGRMAVITFHSLEDRIVKTVYNELATGCICPPDFPICVCGRKPAVKIMMKKPVTASDKELNDNPRSASAKLRVLEKL